VNHSPRRDLRFLSITLNRQVKVIGFCDCRLLPNLEKDDVPNVCDSWLSVFSVGTHKIGCVHKNDFIMAAKTDDLASSQLEMISLIVKLTQTAINRL